MGRRRAAPPGDRKHGLIPNDRSLPVPDQHRVARAKIGRSSPRRRSDGAPCRPRSDPSPSSQRTRQLRAVPRRAVHRHPRPTPLLICRDTSPKPGDRSRRHLGEDFTAARIKRARCATAGFGAPRSRGRTWEQGAARTTRWARGALPSEYSCEIRYFAGGATVFCPQDGLQERPNWPPPRALRSADDRAGEPQRGSARLRVP